MPSARGPFVGVQSRPYSLQLLHFQFGSVRQNSLGFDSTAEVIPEVIPLLAVQGVENPSNEGTLVLLHQ
jgi:hypothetical protein